MDAEALVDRRMTGDAVAEFETAIPLLRQETRIPGDSAQRYLAKSLYNSAFLRELSVDDSVIEPHMREAVQLDPFYADAMLALGNLCLRTERVDEGLAWFEKAGNTNPAAGQPWFYRARHFKDIGQLERTVEDSTKAFEAYSRRGQTSFAADAVMMRGEANEVLGTLHDAKIDYDLAYDYGHTIGFARGDHIRERIAIAEPTSNEARELLGKVIERIENNECPWAQIGFLENRTALDERARGLVDKLQKEGLDDEEIQALVRFLEA